MTEISLIIGAAAGVAAASALIYLLLYHPLRRNYRVAQAELNETQVKNNELQAALLDGQAQAYQTHQAALAQQRRLEGDLVAAHARHTELEGQIASLQSEADRQQKQSQHEAALLRNSIAHLEQEVAELRAELAQMAARIAG